VQPTQPNHHFKTMELLISQCKKFNQNSEPKNPTGTLLLSENIVLLLLELSSGPKLDSSLTLFSLLSLIDKV
jgi:hypothetical protein